jgi:hypothetical protein
MRTTAAFIGSAALMFGFVAAATAAPQGMAPYPGQAGGYAAPAPQGPNGAAPVQKKKTCVWPRRVSNWSAVDNRSMIVYQGRKKYLVTFSGTCRGQHRENGFYVTRDMGHCLDSGDWIRFASPYGYGHRNAIPEVPCVVKSVELMPDHAAAR